MNHRPTAVRYASWFKALADPTRVQIVSLLARRERPMNVGEIVDEVTVGQSTVWAHLKVLADVRFVLVEAQGTARYYRINTACVNGFPTAADQYRLYLTEAGFTALTVTPVAPAAPACIPRSSRRHGDHAPARRPHRVDPSAETVTRRRAWQAPPPPQMDSAQVLHVKRLKINQVDAVEPQHPGHQRSRGRSDKYAHPGEGG
ncbi:ArsR/SmtB family transcription factor [Actinomadura harenae]|uniref:ArsR family transcriptional regulator n=1 Tax=Actinomadura harenae TaxID=2483351 RepID=A0A3M2M048_9ACTN|nr:metalloregulator ArsR/SmtB family transcription factor [Actinomadura harenae]RMI42480.1 ArsR family transcriptional regulator [Actinomadura harenae]